MYTSVPLLSTLGAGAPAWLACLTWHVPLSSISAAPSGWMGASMHSQFERRPIRSQSGVWQSRSRTFIQLQSEVRSAQEQIQDVSASSVLLC